jgi:hypothetical protein
MTTHTQPSSKSRAGEKQRKGIFLAERKHCNTEHDSETEKEVDIIFGEVDKVDDGAGNTDDEDDFDWNASETVRV